MPTHIYYELRTVHQDIASGWECTTSETAITFPCIDALALYIIRRYGERLAIERTPATSDDPFKSFGHVYLWHFDGYPKVQRTHDWVTVYAVHYRPLPRKDND